MNQDQVVARWNQLRDRIEAEARRCATEPDYASQQAVKADIKENQIPVLAGFLGVGKLERERAGETPFVGYLRALAKRDIPKAFKWEIAVVIGGNGYLVLVDYDPDET